MKKYFLILFLSGFLGQVSAVNAGAFEQGIKSFEQKDYVQAEKLWQPLAKEGDVRAQFNLALLWQKGQKQQQKKQATEYLAMSRAEGLIDGYLITLPSPSTGHIARAAVAGNAQPLKIVSEPLLWLNQQPKRSYTLQLATGKSKQYLEKMQKDLMASQLLEQPHNLSVHEIQQSVEQKTSIRYVLLYGVFETYKQAKEQVSKLPESLQKSGPWIRQFAVLQSIVNPKQENIVNLKQP